MISNSKYISGRSCSVCRFCGGVSFNNDGRPVHADCRINRDTLDGVIGFCKSFSPGFEYSKGDTKSTAEIKDLLGDLERCEKENEDSC